MRITDLTTDQLKEYYIDVLGYHEHDRVVKNRLEMIARLSESERQDCITFNFHATA